ncbi:MAG: dGTPase, partial [Actinomycetota bacterium]|nr:dGTPase [Actinomycetota bacterium]
AERLAAYPPLRAVAREAGEPGTLEAQVALKRLTSELVGRFVAAAVDATLAVTGDTPGPDDDLLVPAGARAEVTLLKGAAVRWVMSDPVRLAAQQRERALLTDLVGRLADGAPGVLDPAFRPAWDAAGDAAARLRVVVDQVAVLTDAQARTWSARLGADGPRRLVPG